MISMRIGKQGIPLWFRCFKGKSDENAFAEELLKKGISHVSSLFDDDYNLIFLSDRWFNSFQILNTISSLGHIYNIRVKGNIKVKIFDNVKKLLFINIRLNYLLTNIKVNIILIFLCMKIFL